MQIVTLRHNDSLVINGEIVVKLVAICEDKVKLECLVPREVAVNSTESYEAIPRPTVSPIERHL